MQCNRTVDYNVILSGSRVGYVNNKFHPADLSQQSRTMLSDDRLATFSIGSKQWRRQDLA